MIVAPLAETVGQQGCVLELAKGRGERVLYRIRIVAAVDAGAHRWVLLLQHNYRHLRQSVWLICRPTLSGRYRLISEGVAVHVLATECCESASLVREARPSEIPRQRRSKCALA